MKTRSDLLVAFRFYRDKGDSWGSTMGAYFDACTELALRGVDIPPEHHYRAGACGPYTRDEYGLQDVEDATNGELLTFIEVMRRHSAMLRHVGADY